MTSYRNPWHKKDSAFSGAEFFQTDVRPTEYRGYLIYQRIRNEVWDVVLNGVCVAQRAGMGGAKQRIDELIDGA